MKNKSILYFLPTLLLMACSGNKKNADAYGHFESDEVIVAAESMGKLLFFNFEEGQLVQKGQLMGCIDTSLLSIQLEQLYAQKNLVKSKISQVTAQKDVYNVQVENISKEVKRVENMLKDGAATEKQMDDASGQLKVVKKQLELMDTQYQTVMKELESIDKQIKLIRLQLDKCYIINPVEGTILERYVEPSELVSAGKSLYKIASMKKMYLRAYVSENLLSSFAIGDTVEIFYDSRDNKKEIKGIVNWVSSSAEFTPKVVQTEEERVNLVYAVKIAVGNDGSLKIGMPGEVKFGLINNKEK